MKLVQSLGGIPPVSEKYIPDKEIIELVSNILKKRNVGRLNIEFEANNSTQFYDCGENFENILCPFCNNELNIDWWQNEMSEASECDFSILKTITPCCNKESSLNELNYHSSQGFAKFAIKIEDHELDKLMVDEELLSELKNISSENWRIVLCRY